MKPILLVILAIIALNIRSNAQSLELVNNRPCEAYFIVNGGCPGNPCSYSLIFVVPPYTTRSFPVIPLAIFGSINPAMAPPVCAPFEWHSADVQNNGGCCDGGGLMVGDGACIGPATRCVTPGCSTFCVDWIPFSTPPGSVKVIAN
jgi:hypothetical protein